MPLMLTIACLKLSIPPRICFGCHSFSLYTALNMLQRNSVTFRRRLNHVSTLSVNVFCNPILLPWLAQCLVLVMLTWLMARTHRNRQWTRLSIEATLSCMVSLKIPVVSDVSRLLLVLSRIALHLVRSPHHINWAIHLILCQMKVPIDLPFLCFSLDQS